MAKAVTIQQRDDSPAIADNIQQELETADVIHPDKRPLRRALWFVRSKPTGRNFDL